MVEHALALLADWGSDALARSPDGVDPLWTVLGGGGPWHSRVDVPWYLDRLRSTGRGACADRFALRESARPEVVRIDHEDFAAAPVVLEV